eukprot:3389034-Ditylum_brightwellii.AAC.1
MGLVHLSSICNYWSTDPYMPQHRMMKDLNMTRDHDDGILEFTMDHDQQDQNDDAASDGECSIDDDEEENMVSTRKFHQGKRKY